MEDPDKKPKNHRIVTKSRVLTSDEHQRLLKSKQEEMAIKEVEKKQKQEQRQKKKDEKEKTQREKSRVRIKRKLPMI